MSFHRPHRGLPQEVRNIIYEYALCPLEGITIQAKTCGGLCDDDYEFACVQSVTPGLLRADRQVYEAVLPILYGTNVFCLDMSCIHALNFLRSLSGHSRLQIKSLSLPSRLIIGDEYNDEVVAEVLYRSLISDMHLESITLAVSDKLNCRTVGNQGQFRWFMWTLHQLGEYQDLLDTQRTLYWESLRFNRTPVANLLDAPEEFVRDKSPLAGYSMECDSIRLGEEGTVLVIRRTTASLETPR